MTENELRDYLLENGYEDTVIFTNPSYHEAFIGVSTDGRAIYDYYKMVQCLVDNDGMTDEEAIDWIEYNCVNCYIEHGPIIIYPL